MFAKCSLVVNTWFQAFPHSFVLPQSPQVLLSSEHVGQRLVLLPPAEALRRALLPLPLGQTPPGLGLLLSPVGPFALLLCCCRSTPRIQLPVRRRLRLVEILSRHMPGWPVVCRKAPLLVRLSFTWMCLASFLIRHFRGISFQQFYLSFKPHNFSSVSTVHDCLTAINERISGDFLQLNFKKYLGPLEQTRLFS